MTQEVAGVAVYVDEDGTPYSTSTIAQAISIPTVAVSATPAAVQPMSETISALPVAPSSAMPAPPAASSPALSSSTLPVSSAAPSSSQAVEPAPSVAAAPATSTPAVEQPATTPPPPASTEYPAPPPPPPATSSRANTLDDTGNKVLGMGITYDPYTGAKGSSSCKSEDQISQEFDRMTKDYDVVRIYGADCNLISLAVQNVAKHGKKLMAGAYLSTGPNGEELGKVIQTLKDAVDQNAGGNWDVIALFSVENERVNEGDMTASAVVDAIRQARNQLRGLGYNGPVGAVETVPAMVDNNAICIEADVAMVNSHAFFDYNTQASDAGTFVRNQVEQVKKACGNKRVVVTESGWPHQGNSNGKAIPSPDNQKAALKSIRENFNGDMFLFNAFDSPWKSDTASTFNAEPFWGVL